jgi:hypothetical protein
MTMTVAQVYDQFQLMPNLQTHMYRVAGVAAVICDQAQPSLKSQLHRPEVITACLLHDLGNIIKFDLALFPEFLEPQGLEHWQQVQNEFFAKYGFDEHRATWQIAQELNVSAEVLHLIKAVDFANTKENYESSDFNAKICSYADTRVTPQGVVSLDERLADLEARYHHKFPTSEHSQRRLEFGTYMKKIEAQIFQQMNLEPAAITNVLVEPYFLDFQKMDLP